MFTINITDFHGRAYESTAKPLNLNFRWIVFTMVWGFGGLVLAEESNAPIEEIIVSAKRPVSVAESTTAVSVFGSERIEDFQLLSSRDLTSRVPGLLAHESFGRAKIYIRGLGTEGATAGIDPSVATYMDGVYLGRFQAAYTTQIDLERIEVLRGPQGTISGRNSTGGAINYYSKKPSTDAISGDVRATLANLDTARLEAAINVPFSEIVAVRFAGLVDTQENYSSEVGDTPSFRDTEGVAFKVNLNAAPSENLELSLIADYADRTYVSPSVLRAVSPIYTGIFGFVEGVDYGIADDTDYDTATDIRGKTEEENWGVTFQVDWAIGDYHLASVTGYREFERIGFGDNDASLSDISSTVGIDRAEQFSQELRLTGETKRINWVLGALYFDEDVDASLDTDNNDTDVPLGAISPLLTGGIHLDWISEATNESFGIFGEAEYEITDRFRVTAGATNVLTLDPFGSIFGPLPLPVCDGTPASESWDEVSGNIGFTFDSSDSMTWFGRYARGYRSGGFTDVSICGDTYEPELVDAFELGFRANFQNVSISSTAYYMDYQDLQAQVVVGGTQLVTVNAADSEIYGLELEGVINFPLQGLSLDFNASYLHSRYKTFDVLNNGYTGQPMILNGERTPKAPELSGTVGLEYARELSSGAGLRFRAEVYATDDYDLPVGGENLGASFGPLGEIPGDIFVQDSFALLNLSVTYETQSGYEVLLFAKNLTDEEYYHDSFPGITFIGMANAFAAQPRLFGVRLSARF